MSDTTSLVTAEQVQAAICLVRGQRVLLDSDLAGLYGVDTKVLNQAVKRHAARFPADFLLRLTADEWSLLRSQTVTSRSWGGRRIPPYAFTEQGVAMLSSVLNSERAVLVNIAIMRAFVRLRQVLATHEELARRLTEMEATVGEHGEQLAAVVEAIEAIIAQPSPSPARRIGFRDE
jgi:hypothetical protein